MQLVNLTPHDINIGHLDESGEFQLTKKITNADRRIARVTTEIVPCDPIDGIQVATIRFLEVEGLPPKQENVRYIVSMPVAQFAQDRDDLVCPYSEKAFRKGMEILGVPGFVRYESGKPVETEKKIEDSFSKFTNVSFQPVRIGAQEDGKFREVRLLPKSNSVATMKTEVGQCEPIDGISLFSVKFVGVQGLPEREKGVIYIVPMPVAQFSGREDVLSADTERAFRENGNIVGVPGLVRYS